MFDFGIDLGGMKLQDGSQETRDELATLAHRVLCSDALAKLTSKSLRQKDNQNDTGALSARKLARIMLEMLRSQE